MTWNHKIKHVFNAFFPCFFLCALIPFFVFVVAVNLFYDLFSFRFFPFSTTDILLTVRFFLLLNIFWRYKCEVIRAKKATNTFFMHIENVLCRRYTLPLLRNKRASEHFMFLFAALSCVCVQCTREKSVHIKYDCNLFGVFMFHVQLASRPIFQSEVEKERKKKAEKSENASFNWVHYKTSMHA